MDRSDHLRVIVTDEGNYWFAQGVEIDYCAEGDTLAQAKDRFSEGLVLTAKEHVRKFGGIARMFKLAPQEVFVEWHLAKNKCGFSTISWRDNGIASEEKKRADSMLKERFPSGIQFLEPVLEAQRMQA